MELLSMTIPIKAAVYVLYKVVHFFWSLELFSLFSSCAEMRFDSY